jgi:hypothetical protein
MAKNDTTQTSTQSAASTVALENLTESIARATLRALDERQLANTPANKVNLPIGDGNTVLGIVIPCERFGALGFGDPANPCHCHVIMGIVIMHPPIKPIDPPGTPGGTLPA